MNYLSMWRARMDMIRPANAILAALASVIGAKVAGVEELPVFFAIALATALITSFGNVVNDILDRHIDATAHPQRPLPSGRLQVGQAQSFALLLLLGGLWEAYIAGGQTLLIFAAANAAILWLYARKVKAMGALGNLTVAAMVASAFIFGAIAGSHWAWWGNLWGIAITAFLATFARELLKDAQDAAHDTDRRTLAQRIGQMPTIMLASFLVTAAVALSIPIALGIGPWWLQEPHQQSSALRWLPLVGAVAMLLGLRSDPKQAQIGIKIAMVLVILGYGIYTFSL